MSFGKIVLPAARSIAIRGGLSSENLRSISGAIWPQVERLEVFCGDPTVGDVSGSIDDIMPILSGEGLPRLRHLGLTCCGFLDDLVGRLDQMAILPQLTTLDFSLGALSDEAENVLYEKRTRLSHLQILQLPESRADWIHE
jgi:hypothetical protein